MNEFADGELIARELIALCGSDNHIRKKAKEWGQGNSLFQTVVGEATSPLLANVEFHRDS